MKTKNLFIAIILLQTANYLSSTVSTSLFFISGDLTNVQISVYDVMGEKVYSLVSSIKD